MLIRAQSRKIHAAVVADVKSCSPTRRWHHRHLLGPKPNRRGSLDSCVRYPQCGTGAADYHHPGPNPHHVSKCPDRDTTEDWRADWQIHSSLPVLSYDIGNMKFATTFLRSLLALAIVLLSTGGGLAGSQSTASAGRAIGDAGYVVFACTIGVETTILLHLTRHKARLQETETLIVRRPPLPLFSRHARPAF